MEHRWVSLALASAAVLVLLHASADATAPLDGIQDPPRDRHREETARSIVTSALFPAPTAFRCAAACLRSVCPIRRRRFACSPTTISTTRTPAARTALTRPTSTLTAGKWMVSSASFVHLAARGAVRADIPTCVVKNHETAVMGYHTERELPAYWAYARNFVLQDRMFEPISSWKYPPTSLHGLGVGGQLRRNR